MDRVCDAQRVRQRRMIVDAQVATKPDKRAGGFDMLFEDRPVAGVGAFTSVSRTSSAVPATRSIAERSSSARSGLAT